jgi:uncharacterized protein YcaQ
MLEVSSSGARNALSITHGFISLRQGMEGTLEFFHKHQCVQSDPIEVAGRNADLTLQSRVLDYKQEYLYDLLYKKRQLFEYYCKMLSILPIEIYPIFQWMRSRQSEKHAPFFKEHKKETSLVLKMLEDGPLSSRDIKGWKKVDWWGRTALSKVILERLCACGKVTIHHRDGVVKYYALTEDTVPGRIYSAETPDDEACLKEMVKIIVRASRIVSPSRAPEQWYAIGKTKEVRELLETLEKEGDIFSLKFPDYRDKLYVPMEDKEIWEDPASPESDYVRFLAPLDPLNWNRALFNTVYNIKYAWEVYKKAKDRKYGYYCLPILFNGNMVGLMDPFYRKKDKVLEIRNFHVLDSKIEKKMFQRAVNEELERFSEYLGAEKIEVKCGSKWVGKISL